MKRFILAICLVLFLCGNVFAGKWIRTGTLDQGYFVICSIYDEIPTFCAVAYSNGSVEYTQAEVDGLNDLGEMATDVTFQWYHWKDGYLIKYKMPWRYVEGTEM